MCFWILTWASKFCFNSNQPSNSLLTLKNTHLRMTKFANLQVENDKLNWTQVYSNLLQTRDDSAVLLFEWISRFQIWMWGLHMYKMLLWLYPIWQAGQIMQAGSGKKRINILFNMWSCWCHMTSNDQNDPPSLSTINFYSIHRQCTCLMLLEFCQSDFGGG